MTGFWSRLPRPFFVLAPMEDVTDTVFRRMVARAGRPDVFFTEFTHVDAIDTDGGRERLRYTEEERPIVAQIWGTSPEKFFAAAVRIREMGFDGIDINLGCPEKRITRTGACAALIGENARVEEIIAATMSGAGELPVSVKTRIGQKKVITEEWAGFLLNMKLAAITIHARTAVEMSQPPAHWEEIRRAVEIRNRMGAETLIVGNGDVSGLSDGRSKVSDYGPDGVMIGRGIFANPWLFSGSDLPADERSARRNMFREHVNLWQEVWGGKRNFAVLKKFVKTYVTGYPGAAVIREKLVTAKSPIELTELLRKI